MFLIKRTNWRTSVTEFRFAYDSTKFRYGDQDVKRTNRGINMKKSLVESGQHQAVPLVRCRASKDLGAAQLLFFSWRIAWVVRPWQFETPLSSSHACPSSSFGKSVYVSVFPPARASRRSVPFSTHHLFPCRFCIHSTSCTQYEIGEWRNGLYK